MNAHKVPGMLEAHVRKIEEAIHAAEHSTGMGLHDGKAVIDSSILHRLLQAASQPVTLTELKQTAWRNFNVMQLVLNHLLEHYEDKFDVTHTEQEGDEGEAAAQNIIDCIKRIATSGQAGHSEKASDPAWMLYCRAYGVRPSEIDYDSAVYEAFCKGVAIRALATQDPVEPKADRVGFEAWARRETSRIDLTASKDLFCRDGRFPATYWSEETETAWRAWANRPQAPQPAQKPEDKAEQQAEPVAKVSYIPGHYEAGLTAEIFDLSRVYNGMLLYAKPSTASTHSENVSKTGGEIDRLSDERVKAARYDWLIQQLHGSIADLLHCSVSDIGLEIDDAIERALLTKVESK